MAWHLAQLNIGRLRAEVGDPSIAEFVDNLDPGNALADAAPGFVWRLQTDEAIARLDHLRTFGPSPEAFTFRRPFPHPGGPTVAADERNACPV